MLKLRSLFIVVVISGVSLEAFPHPGQKASDGCHNDSSSGIRHCHNTSSTQSHNSGYARSEWAHWVDADGDCQNLRHELLIAYSQAPVTFSQPNRCRVSTGRWIGAFTGHVFTQASDVDIDHVVPLAFAHSRGGSIWSAAKKRQFANDPDNLLIVEDRLNQQKGAKGIAEWLPERLELRCLYITKFIAVAQKYSLPLSNIEMSVVRSEGCG